VGLGCRVCAPDSELTGLSGPDLTHRTQRTNNEWHSSTVPRAMVCASARNVIYSIICTFLVSPTHSWIQPSPALVCFDVYPLILILLCWLCARSFTHRYHPHVFHTPRVLFLQPISSCLCREDIILNVFVVFVLESRLSPQPETF
jgi:hypothetical protein